MKRLAFSAVILLFGLTSTIASDMLALDKIIEKEFPISKDGTLEIENKYGSVTISESNTNKVQLKITIDVKSSSQKKADEIFDRIEVKFSNSTDFVSAITEIEDKSGWTSWFSWGINTDFQINYEVSVPTSVHIKIENKYGDVYLPDLNNGLDLTLKYGNAVMRSIEGKTNLELGYGNVDFGDLGDLTADIKYSNIKGSSTQSFKIDSKYSSVKIGDVADMKSDTKYDSYVIDQVKSLRNEGKYDNWKLGVVGSITSNSKYSAFDIEKLNGDLRIVQKYGSIRIGGTTCDAASIEMSIEYTDVEIALNGCGVDIDYRGEYTDLRLPREMEAAVHEDGQDTSLKGKFGNGIKKLRIDMEHGELKIW